MIETVNWGGVAYINLCKGCTKLDLTVTQELAEIPQHLFNIAGTEVSTRP